MYKLFYFLLSLSCIVPQIIKCEEHPFSISVSTHDLMLLVNEKETITLVINGKLTDSVNLTFIDPANNYVTISPSWVLLEPLEINNIPIITVDGIRPGVLIITAETVPNQPWIGKDVFIRVIVANSWDIYYISIIFGWIYCISWSISFYPQIIINFQRKSVVGLNFDFLALNIVGFILYSIFNICLYRIQEIENEYFIRHPRGLNPILSNDLIFSLHAVFAISITIMQCFLYEKSDQKVSRITIGILSFFCVVIIISSIFAIANAIEWLDFLYICSYIKLLITLIKYIPQALMNYRRKSTDGWSIGNILLDFIGGIFSMLQMIVNAYNYDDWASLFGDPTKFGLGTFSVCFDIFFMLQHYVFYRNNQPYEAIPGNLEIQSVVNDQENESIPTACDLENQIISNNLVSTGPIAV